MAFSAAITGEFEAFLDQTRLDQTLQFRHIGRLLAGVFTCIGVVVGNLLADTTVVAVDGDYRSLMITISTLTISISLCGMMLSERLGRNLRQVVSTVNERAHQISRYLGRKGWLFFLLAAFGQAVIFCGTQLGFGLFSAKGRFLFVDIFPTIMLALYAWREMPTRSRLVHLYRVTALYQQAAARHAGENVDEKPVNEMDNS
jgi:hypothetical protein